MQISLENKVAVVTGGGSGIGKAISLGLARSGAKVVILELNPEAGEAILAEANEQALMISMEVADVSDGDSVKAAFAAIRNNHERVDILVNNAGVAAIGNVEATTEADMDRIYGVNVKGVYNCTNAAIGGMVAQGSGVVLNLASIASKLGILDRFAYSMSKGAVMAMTMSVARDYVDKGIRCNCVCPARVHTPFVDGYLENHYPDNKEEMFKKLSEYQPIGRMGQPSEIADLVTFLCSDNAGFITGAAYDIDGGVTNLR